MKVGFELVGHTHEDVDQMFSRFSTAMKNAVIKMLTDLVDTIKRGYSPTPHVDIIRACVDFDSLLKPIGKRAFGGTSGPLSAEQEEKPHQMRIKMVEGRARLFMKRLSTDVLWNPVEGIGMMYHNRWQWPGVIKTKQMNPSAQESITQWTDTMYLLQDCFGCGEDGPEMIRQWKRELAEAAVPPPPLSHLVLGLS